MTQQQDAVAPLRGIDWRAAAALIAVAWLAYASPWLFGGLVIPWDAKDYYYPMLRALAAARAAGESGFWNPSLFAGHSSVADPQSWLFTPAFRLLAELHPNPSMTLADAVQLLHLLVGGLGVLMTLRAFGLSPTAAAVAAVAFMFGGVAASRLQHSLMTVSYAHLPWAIWLLHRTFHAAERRARLLASVGFGAVAGLMAIDRDQIAFLNCYVLIGMTLWWLVQAARRSPTEAAARLAELVPAAVVGVALLAVPMLLTLDALTRSTRPEISFADAGFQSMHPSALLTLIAPNALNAFDPDKYWGELAHRLYGIVSGHDWSDRTTGHLYLGALPLAGLLLAAAARGRWPAGAGLFAGGLAFALLYALGSYTPAYRPIYDGLPGVDLYRRPNDAAFLIVAMTAFLSAFAIDKIARAPDLALAPGRTALVAVALVAALGAGLIFAAELGQLRRAAVTLGLGLAFVAAAGAMLGYGRTARHPRLWALAILTVAAGDLIRHHAGASFNGHAAANIAAYRPEGERLFADIEARLNAVPGGPWRAEIFGLLNLPGGDGGGSWQNAALAYGVQQTLGYNPLQRADYAAATGAFQNNHLAVRQLTPLFTGYDSPLARLLGIKFVVLDRPIETVVPPTAARSLTLVARVEGAFVYENAAPLPRAMIVPRAEPDTGGALPVDPTEVVLIDGLAAPQGEPSPAGRVEIVRYRADEVRLAAELTRPAFLVLNDLIHPLWMVSVDGVPQPIRRANRLFRAVALPAGRHEVVFSFNPLTGEALAAALARVIAAR